MNDEIQKEIITVKNADGDPDTTAEILVRGKIDYTPKVSVIIPVYNVEEYLRQCMDSVVNQTLKEIEIICVDDGSTDSSLDILKEYAEKDTRITIIHQQNLHAGVARNAGLAVAKGEYLSFLDSDDFFELNMLEDVYNIAKKEISDICIFQYRNFDNETHKIGEARGININFSEKKSIKSSELGDKLFVASNPMPWNKLYNKDFFCRENIHFQSLKASNDVGASLTALGCADIITFVPNSYCKYRFNRKNSLKNTRDKNPYDFYSAYKYVYDFLTNKKIFEKTKDAFFKSLCSSTNWTLNHTDKKYDDVKVLVNNVMIPYFKLDSENKKYFDSRLKDRVSRSTIIVSLTSFPARIGTVNQTIESLLNQTFKADKVILWLAPEQFPNKEADLPKQLLDLREKGLTIDWYHDIRSYKKLIPTLKKYPDAVIVTADDDLIYSQDWLKKLWDSYQKNPADIHCHRVTKFMYSGERFITKAGGWDYYPHASFLNKLGSGSGTLFPPHCFTKDVLNENLIERLAPTNDDQWFWLQAAMNNIKVRVPDMPENTLHYVSGTQECGLTAINDHGQRLFWKDFYRLLDYYPQARKILIDEAKREHNPKFIDSPYRQDLEKWYLRIMRQPLNLDRPRTFNEKLQWLKLYDSTPIKTRLADKYSVRDWVKEKIGEQYLIPLLGVYDKFEDIDFDKLPNRFVIKCNHGSGYNIIVKNKSELDLKEVKQKLDKWMHENFAFKVGFELHYRDIQPKIIIEKFIENEKSHDLYDYKFWCFNGKVEYIQFLSERNISGLKMAFYDKKWNKQTFVYSHPLDEKTITKPDNLNQMLNLAEKLSENFPHVRVDFYRLDDGTLYFGEMTFTSASGMCAWNEKYINNYFGNMIKLPKLAYDIDAGKYYKLKRKSKLLLYILFPYNLLQREKLKRKLSRKMEKCVEDTLHTFRLDVKNVGKSENGISITGNTLSVAEPAWLSNAQGRGKVVTGSSLVQKMTVKAIKDGKLSIVFRGQDKRDKSNVRFPVYIDFTSIKINGNEQLKIPVTVWHDKPFKYEMPVKDGQVVQIAFEQSLHNYAPADLTDTLKKLFPSSNYVLGHMNSIVKTLVKKMPNQKKEAKKTNPLFSVTKQGNKKIYRVLGLKITRENRFAALSAEITQNRVENGELFAKLHQALSKQIVDALSRQDIVKKELGNLNNEIKSLAEKQTGLQKVLSEASNLIVSAIHETERNAVKEITDQVSRMSSMLSNELMYSTRQSEEAATALENQMTSYCQTLQNSLFANAKVIERTSERLLSDFKLLTAATEAASEKVNLAVKECGLNAKDGLFRLTGELTRQTDEINANVSETLKEQTADLKSELAVLSKDVSVKQEENAQDLKQKIQKAQTEARQNYQELNFADLLHDTTLQTAWLKDKSFTCFRGAANYGFLYTLFRVLDKANPQTILEMGMGQTSKLTTQYAAFKHPDAKLDIVENDKNWIDLYSAQLAKGDNIRIHHQELEFFTVNGIACRKYADMTPIVQDTKYQLIVVDGPFGADQPQPRTNIIGLVDNNLADDFVIIFDDAERAGEQDTIRKTKQRLSEKGIKFVEDKRTGIKTQVLLLSESRSFINFL